MKAFPLGKVFHLLEPGPVVLLTTFHMGRANIMTMSWHMMMEFEPPLIGCLVSGANHSFTALRSTRECVIAIPTVDLISKVVDIGNCSGEDIDKFETFGLTPVAAEQVKAPLVAECLANIECKVVDTSLVNKYNMFILEGVYAWSDPGRKERRTFHANGDGTFVVDEDYQSQKENGEMEVLAVMRNRPKLLCVASGSILRFANPQHLYRLASAVVVLPFSGQTARLR